MDSIQIQKAGYHASVLTDEYAPPECYLQNLQPRQTFLKPSWDYFSYGVIAYKLLFGLHPFSASHQNKQITTIPQLIEQYCFVHGCNQHLLTIPPPHQEFLTTSTELQSLFLKTFETKKPQDRIGFQRWVDVLQKEIKNKPVKQTKSPYRIGFQRWVDVFAKEIKNKPVKQTKSPYIGFQRWVDVLQKEIKNKPVKQTKSPSAPFPEGKLLHSFEGHSHSVRLVAFSPDGQFLLSGSDDHTVRLWRMADAGL